jgi:hypothetical protein
MSFLLVLFPVAYLEYRRRIKPNDSISIALKEARARNTRTDKPYVFMTDKAKEKVVIVGCQLSLPLSLSLSETNHFPH